jgi:hypothetical protein
MGKHTATHIFPVLGPVLEPVPVLGLELAPVLEVVRA